MLERLRDRAKIAFAQCQSGHGQQQTVDESEFPDDVAIISGRASVINRSGSSQSPNSTSRLSESPQSMPMGISGVKTSPNTSPVVSSARAYGLHGDVNMSIGDVMQDLGLEYYNPNHNPSYPHQHPQYMNDINGVGGMNGMSGVGVNGIGMNGMNGGVSHGSGGMDQMYNDPHSQQQYMMVRVSSSNYREFDLNLLLVTGPASHISPTGLFPLSGRGLAVAWTWGSRRDLDEFYESVDDDRWTPPPEWIPASDGTPRLKLFYPFLLLALRQNSDSGQCLWAFSFLRPSSISQPPFQCRLSSAIHIRCSLLRLCLLPLCSSSTSPDYVHWSLSSLASSFFLSPVFVGQCM